MSNKLDKFLISFSGIMIMVSGVLVLKFQKESQEIAKLKKDLQSSLTLTEKEKKVVDIQTEMKVQVQAEVVPEKTAPQSTTKTVKAIKTTKTS